MGHSLNELQYACYIKWPLYFLLILHGFLLILHGFLLILHGSQIIIGTLFDRMFLCNFLGCGGAGRLNEMSERNLLNAINESDRVAISLKENAPYIPSSAHHSKKASLNKQYQPYQHHKSNSHTLKTEASTILSTKQSHLKKKLSCKKHEQIIHPKIFNQDSTAIKREKDVHAFIYPPNQPPFHHLIPQQDNRYSHTNRAPLTPSQATQTPLSRSRNISISSISTNNGQTPALFHFQQKHRLHKGLQHEKSLNSMANSHVKSTSSLQYFKVAQVPFETPVKLLNNYAINYRQKEDKSNNFVIIEHNESSLSLNDTFPIINPAKNMIDLPRKYNKKGPKQEKGEINNLSSIKLIKQSRKKSKQVRFQGTIPQRSQRQRQGQDRKHNIFRIVDTIKSIDESVVSYEHSYLDLKFMNNFNSNRLFSKLT